MGDLEMNIVSPRMIIEKEKPTNSSKPTSRITRVDIMKIELNDIKLANSSDEKESS